MAHASVAVAYRSNQFFVPSDIVARGSCLPRIESSGACSARAVRRVVSRPMNYGVTAGEWTMYATGRRPELVTQQYVPSVTRQSAGYESKAWKGCSRLLAGLIMTAALLAACSSPAANSGSGSLSNAASGSWSGPVEIDPHGQLSAVSCSSSASCVALDNTASFTYSNSKWATAIPFGNNGGMPSLSCPSSSFCLAVDESGNAFTYRGGTWSSGLAITNGTTWGASCSSSSFCAVASSVGAYTYSDGQWVGSGTGSAQPGAVSCPSASFCMAVPNGGASDSYIYSQGKWTPIAIPANSQFSSVSCPSSSFCIALNGGKAYMYTNRHWTTGAFVGTKVQGISCPTASFCVAVGGGDAYTYMGGTWSKAHRLFDASGSSGLVSVSCPMPSFCVAVGEGSAYMYSEH